MRSSMFEYMNIFVQVVEQGGFARAADVYTCTALQ